jgi:hypothetical protein
MVQLPGQKQQLQQLLGLLLVLLLALLDRPSTDSAAAEGASRLTWQRASSCRLLSASDNIMVFQQ